MLGLNMFNQPHQGQSTINHAHLMGHDRITLILGLFVQHRKGFDDDGSCFKDIFVHVFHTQIYLPSVLFERLQNLHIALNRGQSRTITRPLGNLILRNFLVTVLPHTMIK
ncbi:hypothetical protein E2C01_022514 [Portunus trituberculatus]|uniref:Uncharacterized protein n=1 Tax=Portunus trituberculatus TaxID=210409 RepID=A0A5B7E794_PORTR|nr:hypothetical protein [Portunus trituberculatus]